MGDAPGTSARQPLAAKPEIPLSESEEDDGEADDPEAPAVERAVLQLTRVLGGGQSPAPRFEFDFNSILDRAETGGAESSSSGSGRSKAAAYRKLRSCLHEAPSFLYEAVEDAMAEDFNQVRSTPSLAGVPVSTRGWVEHRSRLGPYPASIRAMWILGAVHDCLKEGRVEEARARVALALCAYDQSAADSGNWLLSQELLLEQALPYNSFNRNRGNPDKRDVLHTRLADARWIKILMARLRAPKGTPKGPPKGRGRGAKTQTAEE